MMNDLLTFLFDAAVVSSLALLFVLFLRGAWRRGFGARSALLLWWIVPMTLLALFWPAPAQHIDLTDAGATTVTEPLLPALRDGIATTLPALPATDRVFRSSTGVDPTPWILALWAAGAFLFGAVLALSQWRLVRALGRLTPMPDGSFRSTKVHSGPVLVGAIRPRIVLPSDFERRYSRAQRDLVMAHERCHLRRGDAQFTLLACLLRCVFWFNPLVHLAWPRFRMDQELACDAAVLRRYPDRRRDYAEAMLATRVDAPRLPVGCAWLSGHPLKERIRRIGAEPIGPLRLGAGSLLVLLAVSTAAVGAWTHQEPQRYFMTRDLLGLQVQVVPTEPELNVPEWPREWPAARSAMPTPEVAVRPPLPSTESAPVSAVEPDPASSAPAPVAASVPSATLDRPEPVSEPVPETNPATTPETVEVEHAALVVALRPAFPTGRAAPRLIRYPGMPEHEGPGEDGQPEGGVWVLLLRVSLDESGRATDAIVEDTNLDNRLMVERYERLAMESVREWRFAPARIDGDPVQSEVLLPFYFDVPASTHSIERVRVGANPSPAPAAAGVLSRVNR